MLLRTIKQTTNSVKYLSVNVIVTRPRSTHALRQRRHTGAELVPSRQIYLVTEPLLKGPSEATALVRTRERPLRNDVLFSFLL